MTLLLLQVTRWFGPLTLSVTPWPNTRPMMSVPPADRRLAGALDLALIVVFPFVAVLAIAALPYLMVRWAYGRADAFIDTVNESRLDAFMTTPDTTRDHTIDLDAAAAVVQPQTK